VKGRRGPGRRGNTRDRARDRKRSTHERGCPLAMEGISGLRERLIFTERRRKRSWRPVGLPHAKARSRITGSDRGARGTARSGAPAESCRAPTSMRACRSGFGVVKRQVHRSRWSSKLETARGCMPVGQGRGVSLEEMPVAHETRVLVVRQWEAEVGRTHRDRCPRRAARQTVGTAS
jgi:hypothetical protein